MTRRTKYRQKQGRWQNVCKCDISTSTATGTVCSILRLHWHGVNLMDWSVKMNPCNYSCMIDHVHNAVRQHCQWHNTWPVTHHIWRCCSPSACLLMSVRQCAKASVCLLMSVRQSVCLLMSVRQCLCLCLLISVRQCVCLCLLMSVRQCVCLSVFCLSIKFEIVVYLILCSSLCTTHYHLLLVKSEPVKDCFRHHLFISL